MTTVHGIPSQRKNDSNATYQLQNYLVASVEGVLAKSKLPVVNVLEKLSRFFERQIT